MRFVAIGSLDPSIYSKLLQKCIDGKAAGKGRLVHKQIISSGLGLDVALNNKLIVFYAKLDDMVNAQKVFDKMSGRNVVSWTALLSGYSKNDYFEEALLVFREMRCSGLRGNQFTYGSVFKACTKLQCLKLGRQIQGCVYKSRFAMNLFVQSALIDLYSKCGDFEDAVHIFESIPWPDLVCWNSMICGFAVHGMLKGSFRTFQSMLIEGISPDCFTFGSLLSVSAVSNRLSKVSEVHGFIIQHGFGSHDLLGGLLIDAYAKCGNMRRACHVFKSMPTKDLFACTNMITGYSREVSCASDALSLFCEIHRIGIQVDDVLLCSVVNVCADISSLSFGRQLHAIIAKYHPGFDVAMGNAVVNMYGNCGELEDANRMFTELDEKNVISWSSLIGAYAKHGYGHKAIALFRMMESQGLKPNEVTFLSVIFACSHSGLTTEGREYFNIMIDKYRIAPTEKHYSCMVDLFARGGKLEEAFRLVKKMNIQQPKAALWSSILGACNVHGSVSLAEAAARHLFNLEPDNSTNYIVLSSIYAALSLWDNASNTRLLMEQRSLKKSPGCSYFDPTPKGTELLQS